MSEQTPPETADPFLPPDDMLGAGSGLHVAIVVYCLEGGGVQRQTLTLAREMVARGSKVDYVVFRSRGELTDEIPDGVNLVTLLPDKSRATSQKKNASTWDKIRGLPALIAYLRRERPDALLSGGSHANIIAAIAHKAGRTGGRLILRVTSHMTRAKRGGKTLRRLSSGMAMLIYPVADSVVSVSNDVQRDFLRATAFNPRRAAMIREPVITSTISTLARQGSGHPWFRPGEPPVILAVGRLSPEKDFATLIRAFAAVRRERDARLIIVGAEVNPKHAETLRKLARDLGVVENVDLVGYSRNPYAFMAEARVFALSSLWEGCPNVLAEAIYCGCAIVATDCPGGVREVLQNGAKGALVPVGDPDSMAKALITALDTGNKNDIFNCPEGFDAATSVAQYLAVLSGSSFIPASQPELATERGVG